MNYAWAALWCAIGICSAIAFNLLPTVAVSGPVMHVGVEVCRQVHDDQPIVSIDRWSHGTRAIVHRIGLGMLWFD